MNKQDYAVQLKNDHHNCAQAVLCSYAEEVQIPAETLKKIGAAFGGGMGNMEGNCGALCGAEAVLGLLKFQGKSLGKDATALYRTFQKSCGSTICKEIKGVETGRVLCTCDDCVKNAVTALEKTLLKNGI